MKIDPEFKNLIAPLRPDELEGLEKSIKKDGCRDPLCVWGDVLVDGHNRHEICERLGISYKTQAMTFADRLDAMIWIRENQVSRRNLTDDQRAMNAEELGELLSARAIRDRAKKGGTTGGKNHPKSQLVGDVLPQAEKVEPVGRLKQNRLSATSADKRSDLVGDVLQQDQNK